MKKLLLTGIIGLFIITSCSSIQKAKTAQVQRSEFLKMKGEWEITSIDYDKSFKIKPFDENADAKCFIGSHWNFVPNNYTGSYRLNGGGDCPAIEQQIRISENVGNEFIFKKVNADQKAKNVTAGYSLDLMNQATDQFSLQQNIPFEGQNIKVTYNFQRTGKN